MLPTLPTPNLAKPLLTDEEVAKILRTSVRALRRDREDRQPTIPYIKIGRSILYDPQVVAAVLLNNTVGRLANDNSLGSQLTRLDERQWSELWEGLEELLKAPAHEREMENF